ncbi:MAG: SRPBCC family protein [Bacteroidota bacterium]
MKTLKKIGIIIGILVILLLVIGVFLPAEFGMQRQIVIQAPINSVFEEVNDLKNWEKWSPFAASDPSMQVSYGDKTIGKGASYSWVGDINGIGEQFILESVLNQKIETKIEFQDQGRESTGFGHWQFKEVAEGVEVTWGFSANANSYFEKYFGALIDPLLGGDFENGLNRLKKVSEAKAKGMSVN